MEGLNLLRDSIATESIYGFAPEQANEQPSEEPIFVLTSAQLQEIIAKAIQPLQDRVEALEVIVAHQDGIKAKFEALEKDMDSLADNQLIQLRLIADIRKDHEPQPLQKDRAEILRALVVANGGKILATDARKMMHMDRASFSRLLAVVKDEIEVKPYHLNKSWKVLVLK